MIDLVEVLNGYSENNVEYGVESSFIKGLLLLRDWDTLSDEDKINKRKERLKYYKKHFNLTEGEIRMRNYEESVVNLSELIILFLKNSFDECSSEFDRIKVMLYCELFNLNKNYSYRIINHIPFFVLLELKGKLTNLEEFNKYELDILFSCYQEMYKLFLQKPYDTNK